MDDNTAREWTLLLSSQRGIIGNSQTQRVGVPRKAVRHRLDTGQWRRMHRGVYATFTGEAPREAMLWAAVKRAGEGAMVSHETAAEVHGLTDKPRTMIHITVPHSRRPAQSKPIQGVVIHRSDQSRPQLLPSWLLPRTRIEDTVLDLVAAAGSFDEAYSWVSRALSKQLVTVGMLREAMTTRTRIRWRAWLAEALADADDGAYFPLERRYARDVERAHGLPRAQRQARRTMGGTTHYKDNWYPDYGICVELDGAAYHPPEQIGTDKRRDNINLGVDGVGTFRFGIVDVTERACDSAGLVAASLRRNGWQGQPRPCRRPECTAGVSARGE
jgi:hypothetical protein